MSSRAVRNKPFKRNPYCRFNLAFALSFVAGLFAFHNSHAEDTPKPAPKLPSIINFISAMDGDGGSEYYLGSDTALSDGQRLSMTAGKIYLGSKTQFNSGLDPLNFSVGLSSRPGTTFPAGVEYEFWGEEGEFTIQALRGFLGYNHKWFSFTASPQAREFTLYFNDGRKLKFDSNGFNFKLDIQGIKNLLISLAYTKNDYDFTVFRLLSVLAKRETDVLRRLSELRSLYVIGQRLQSASSFDDRIYNAGVNYYFTWGDVGAYWVRSRSVIKDPDSGEPMVRHLYGIAGTVDLSPDWSLGLQLGAQTASNDTSTLTSGSMSLSYYW